MANYSIAEQTSFWLKSKGLTLTDLTHHEQIDDVILLANIKDEFRNDFNLSQEGYWAALWSYVYYHKHSLKSKHLKKLELILSDLQSQRQAKLHRLAIQRGKILRLKKGAENPSTKQKGRGYMTTNALPTELTLLIEG